MINPMNQPGFLAINRGPWKVLSWSNPSNSGCYIFHHCGVVAVAMEENPNGRDISALSVLLSIGLDLFQLGCHHVDFDATM